MWSKKKKKKFDSLQVKTFYPTDFAEAHDVRLLFKFLKNGRLSRKICCA